MSRPLFHILTLFALVVAALSCGKEPGPSGEGKGNETPSDYTISGTVRGDDGNLLQDVVVSDGLHCAVTDAQGRYFLPADLSLTRYVMVSTPSGYAAPVREGHACFWQFLKDASRGADGKYEVDFTLQKIATPERYTVLIFADPQPRKASAGLDKIAYHSLDCCEDMYRDMKEFVEAHKGYPVYGIGLGDIVGDMLREGGTEKWSPDELDEMLEGLGASVETSGDVTLHSLSKTPLCIIFETSSVKV